MLTQSPWSNSDQISDPRESRRPAGKPVGSHFSASGAGACPVYANSAPVRKHDLQRAIWDLGRVPAGGLKSVISDLRSSLLKTFGAENTVTYVGDAYALPLDTRHVDVFRFAAKLDEASQRSGAEGGRLRQEALREWPQASGLFGGYPLLGLDTGWASGLRKDLRAQYRDVVIGWLRQEARAGDYATVLRECAQLAASDHGDPGQGDPQEAMTDVDFLAIWIFAARQSGQRERADQLLREAKATAERTRRPVIADLERRLQSLRDEVSGPSAPAPGPAPMRPVSPVGDRGTATGSTVNFHNAGAVINGQFATVYGGVTFNAGGGPARES